MEEFIKKLREEVNSFGGYVDITKSMGHKPYLIKRKDERIGSAALVRYPVASSSSFRPEITKRYLENFNDFLDDVCIILRKGKYRSIAKLRKLIENEYYEKYDKPPFYNPTYIPDEDDYYDDLDYYKGAEFAARRILKEIDKIANKI